MKNRFELQFAKTQTCIAGYEYGLRVYKEQIENEISFDTPIVIVFPNRVIKVASSFVQGLFKGIIDNIGYEGVDNKVEIEAGTEMLASQIRSRIR